MTGKPRNLPIVFDTGASMTTVDSGMIARAGYKLNDGVPVTFSAVGSKSISARAIIVRGFELAMFEADTNDIKYVPIGPVLVYVTDMSEVIADAVLGLNVIREFETVIKFGKQPQIELNPTFDINRLLDYDNFLPTESRFGEYGGKMG